QLRARRPVACIPLTPNHCRSRREWCQARAHWRTEWRSVLFSDESRFYLGASDYRVLVRRRPGERLQPICLRHRHTGPTSGVTVWGAISYDSRSTLVVIRRTLTANLYVSLVIQPVVLPFMNSIQVGVFQQDNDRPNTAVVTQHALQSVDMLPWPARSPNLSPIEHVWNIIGRQLQRHPQPALTVPVLTDKVQQAWNSIPQTDIRHLYDTMHSRLHACIQNSGGYTGY
ncbi:Transposable element Tc1 transposase, partial [Araneus ventricosus]